MFASRDNGALGGLLCWRKSVVQQRVGEYKAHPSRKNGTAAIFFPAWRQLYLNEFVLPSSGGEIKQIRCRQAVAIGRRK